MLGTETETGVVEGKEGLALRFWKASLAWKNIGGWAKGWTQGAFIEELQVLCLDNGVIGSRADELLDMMIRDVERCPLACPGEVVVLKARPKSLVNELSNTTNKRKAL